MTTYLIDAISGWFSGLRIAEPDAFALAPIGIEGEDDGHERFDSSVSPLEEFR